MTIDQTDFTVRSDATAAKQTQRSEKNEITETICTFLVHGKPTKFQFECDFRVDSEKKYETCNDFIH